MYQGMTLIFRLLTLSAMLLSTITGIAQDDLVATPFPAVEDVAGSHSPTHDAVMKGIAADSDFKADTVQLRLPRRFAYGTMPIYTYWPSRLLGGYDCWQLHEGLNASLSTAAIFGLGHHGGSGFAYGLSLAYAGNITPRLSYAIGGYSQLLNYGGSQLRDAGLTAVLDYRIDNHWETTAFVQKSIVEPRLPYQLYWLDDVGDKIGASLHYHFNPSLSIGISVWSQSQPYPSVR